MKLSFTQIIGLITIIIITTIIIIGISTIAKSKQEKIEYITYKKEDITVKINGDFVEYIPLNQTYEEKGAQAKYKGKRIKVLIDYYKNNQKVSNIDTSTIGNYLVRYTAITKNKKNKTAYKTIIINDTKAPTIIVPKVQTITAQEAASFDLKNGVIVNDNSGDATLTYDNTLSTISGNYIITYKAKDQSGNISTKKRLIKVTQGIVFSLTDKLKITFPENKDYTYKYSLDNGYTWINCSQTVEINLKKGTIIGTVIKNGKIIMANSYTKKI